MTHSIAILLTEKDTDVDCHVTTSAKELICRGFNLAGFVQREQHDASSACCSDMYLADIASGERFRITQNLGSGASGCRLDPAGLVDAVAHLTPQVNEQLDLLLINRFGKGEEEGRGFRPTIEAAFLQEIPTLIVVRHTYLEAWKTFCGDNYTLLPADKEAIVGWAENQLHQKNALEPA